jgi:GNAT superfamily N-acetyltransferase
MTTDPAELDRTVHLLNGVFDLHPPATAAALRWYYDDNPVGSAAVGRVEEGGERVGNYALVPQVFVEPGGTRRTLGLGVDLAVHPDARGSGAFRRTVEDAYQRGRQAGFDGILGVANANSAPRMVATLGWRALEPLPVTVCAPTARRLDVAHHPVTEPFLAGGLLDDLIGDGFPLPAVPGFAPAWDGDGLRWRLRRPDRAYWVHASEDLLVVSTRTYILRMPFVVILKALPRKVLEAPLPVEPLASALGAFHRTPLVVHWGRNPWLRVRGVRLPQARMPSPLSLVLHSFHDGFVPASFGLSAFEFLDFDAY